jgi:hypothetical protein
MNENGEAAFEKTGSTKTILDERFNKKLECPNQIVFTFLEAFKKERILNFSLGSFLWGLRSIPKKIQRIKFQKV